MTEKVQFTHLPTRTDLHNASTVDLHHLRKMVEEELETRRCSGPYLICSIGVDGKSVIVTEARLDFDEAGRAHYVQRHPEDEKSFTLTVDAASVLHDKPNPGDAFDIALRDGHIVDSALRLESGKYTLEDEAKHGHHQKDSFERFVERHVKQEHDVREYHASRIHTHHPDHK